jgi:hypothetical protein
MTLSDNGLISPARIRLLQSGVPEITRWEIVPINNGISARTNRVAGTEVGRVAILGQESHRPRASKVCFSDSDRAAFVLFSVAVNSAKKLYAKLLASGTSRA